ncbi:hypothetical protein LOTGIDRAFT_161988 [Lottia gigantea]|uniref:Uncharacterized protein n=1 Tax=Lottia gigantea TaxID=225164 RepID=V4AHT9_LOTGI|nr:hypothetical protein LOTGIDRAFT_161988 [Lottia gigantea]ESO92961.1 hypothetical protein LOTGIDRAFT_161988 [Lottia gigantea]
MDKKFKHSDIFPSNPMLMCICGSSGCGKTYLTFNMLTTPNILDFESLCIYTTTPEQSYYQFLKALEYVSREDVQDIFHYYESNEDLQEKAEIKDILDGFIKEKNPSLKPTDVKVFLTKNVNDLNLSKNDNHRKNLIVFDDCVARVLHERKTSQLSLHIPIPIFLRHVYQKERKVFFIIRIKRQRFISNHSDYKSRNGQKHINDNLSEYAGSVSGKNNIEFEEVETRIFNSLTKDIEIAFLRRNKVKKVHITQMIIDKYNADGAAGIAKAVNNKKADAVANAEACRHNLAMERVTRGGSGVGDILGTVKNSDKDLAKKPRKPLKRD